MAPPAGTAEINAQSPATIQFFRPWPELLLAFTVMAWAEWDCFAEHSAGGVMCNVWLLSGHTKQGRADTISLAVVSPASQIIYIFQTLN